MAVVKKCQGLGQAAVQFGSFGLASGLDLLGLCDLRADALLFLTEQIERECVSVGHLQELAAFLVELAESDLLSLDLLAIDAAHQLDVGSDGVSDLVDLVAAQAHSFVVLLDRSFDFRNRHVALLAVGSFLVASHAEEVRVDGALLTSALGEGHAGTAVSAVDCADQVVPVLLRAGGALSVVVQHGLDGLPGVHIDDGRVLAFVFHAAVVDDADVVGVGQHAVDL